MPWFGSKNDPQREAAQARALDHVRALHPSWTVTNGLLRAEEPDRWVFAVCYAEPGVRVVPGRYLLVAVARQGDLTETLETSPRSPYWIRGLK
jgi:hypothetical protein